MKIDNHFKYTAIFIISFFIISFHIFDPISNVFAHIFTTNDVSHFLSLDKRTKIELNLAEKNYPSNITLTMDHIDNAEKLVYDIYFTDDNIVDDNDFIKRYDEVMNSSSLTTYALVVADLIDETLKEYANAIVTDIDLTNMSNLRVLYDAKNLTIFSGSGNQSSNTNYTRFFSSNNSILNYANYETAMALGAEINDIFENHLIPPSNYIDQSRDTILKLDKNFEKLSDLVINNGSLAELMELVYLQIYPLLQEGYGLQTKIDMNGEKMDM